MKNIATLFFTPTIIFFHPLFIFAQQQNKPKTEITSVKQEGKYVAYTINSSKPFIVGNNVYVLRIGDKDFTLKKNTKEKSSLTFLIPVADFNAIAEGGPVYLTYGHIFKGGEQNKEELCEKLGTCSSLGKFNKDRLDK